MDLLQAFTDDSAAQAGDKRLYLAGYLHRADVWASFSKDWHKELKAWPAIEYLKANRQDGAAKLELVRSLEKIKAFLLELKARL